MSPATASRSPAEPNTRIRCRRSERPVSEWSRIRPRRITKWPSAATADIATPVARTQPPGKLTRTARTTGGTGSSSIDHSAILLDGQTPQMNRVHAKSRTTQPSATTSTSPCKNGLRSLIPKRTFSGVGWIAPRPTSLPESTADGRAFCLTPGSSRLLPRGATTGSTPPVRHTNAASAPTPRSVVPDPNAGAPRPVNAGLHDVPQAALIVLK